MRRPRSTERLKRHASEMDRCREIQRRKKQRRKEGRKKEARDKRQRVKKETKTRETERESRVKGEKESLSPPLPPLAFKVKTKK